MRAILCLAFLLTALPSMAIDPTTFDDPALQKRYTELTHELRCLKCQNEAIADSPSEVAGDLRRETKELLLAGKTDNEVREFMVARYGDFILFKPRFTPRNLWLWFGPAIMILLGVLFAIRIVRQRAALVDRDNDVLEESIEEEAGRR